MGDWIVLERISAVALCRYIWIKGETFLICIISGKQHSNLIVYVLYTNTYYIPKLHSSRYREISVAKY